jgi:predicted acylesterase/phospholipase RssA
VPALDSPVFSLPVFTLCGRSFQGVPVSEWCTGPLYKDTRGCSPALVLDMITVDQYIHRTVHWSGGSMKHLFNNKTVYTALKYTDGERARFKPFLDFIRGKRVFLALSGGGLPLVCHIAILRFIETYKVPVERIYGVSAGAVIGGFFAAGVRASQLREAALLLKDPDDLFGKGSRYMLIRAVKAELQSLFKKGSAINTSIYDGKKLDQYVTQTFVEFFGTVPLFRNLARDYTAIAFDIGRGTGLDTSTKAVFSPRQTPDVSVKDAIVASMSIPGVLPPKKIGDRYYLDGGIVEHLPIITAFEDWIEERKRARKKLVIIAVDLGYLGEKLRNKSEIKMHDMLTYTFNMRGKMITQLSLLRAHKPDQGSYIILLKPRCYNIGLTEFEKIPDALDASYDRILKQLEGDNFLKETEEDLEKARQMIGINEKF